MLPPSPAPAVRRETKRAQQGRDYISTGGFSPVEAIFDIAGWPGNVYYLDSCCPAPVTATGREEGA